jgi:hypothetical protein
LFQHVLQQVQVREENASAGEVVRPMVHCHMDQLLSCVTSSMADSLLSVTDAEVLAGVLDEIWATPLQQLVDLLSRSSCGGQEGLQLQQNQGADLQQRQPLQPNCKLLTPDLLQCLLGLWEKLLHHLVHLQDSKCSGVQRYRKSTARVNPNIDGWGRRLFKVFSLISKARRAAQTWKQTVVDHVRSA